MRYEGTRPSKVDKDADVYVLAVGIEELKLMLDIFNDTHKRIPRTLVTNPMMNRLRNMRKEVGFALRNRQKKDEAH